MDYIDERQARGTLPLFVMECGCWWGNDPIKKREEEIDLVALSSERILLRECIMGGAVNYAQRGRVELIAFGDMAKLQRRPS